MVIKKPAEGDCPGGYENGVDGVVQGEPSYPRASKDLESDA
jgi:hypothetical protein